MKCIIIDDDPRLARLLQHILSTVDDSIQSTIETEVARALKRLASESFDLVFLDIEMPFMDGFDVIEASPGIRSSAIIITTAHPEYALKAFQVDVVDYLVKPVTEDALKRSLEKAQRFLQGANKDPNPNPNPNTKPDHLPDIGLPLYDGQAYHFIAYEQIVRLEADGSYTKVVLMDNHTMTASKRLRLIEEELEGKGFFRCHRSHLIQWSFVQSFTRNQGAYLVMKNGDVVPVSSGFREKVSKKLNG